MTDHIKLSVEQIEFIRNTTLGKSGLIPELCDQALSAITLAATTAAHEATIKELRENLLEIENALNAAGAVAARHHWQRIQSLDSERRRCKDESETAERALAEAYERLEIVYAYNGEGERIPFPKGAPDGISCRDETIRLLQKGCDEVNAEVLELRKPVGDVSDHAFIWRSVNGAPEYAVPADIACQQLRERDEKIATLEKKLAAEQARISYIAFGHEDDFRKAADAALNAERSGK